MDILWRLVLAHFLADFTLQTNFIADWKRRSVVGGFIHSFIFLLCGFAFCFSHLQAAWITLGPVAINGWFSLLLLSVLHFLEDEWRIWSIQKHNTPDSLLFFLWDQFVHLALIFVFFPAQAAVPPEKGVLLAILFILTTHFTSVFIYFLEKELFGFSRVLVHEKYYSMAERLVTSFSLLLPGYWAFSFLAVWVARIAVLRLRQGHEFSPLNVLAGNLIAFLIGLAARAIYYAP